MLTKLYSAVIRFPKLAIAIVIGVTVFLATQLPHLRWETDARVYLPKGHAAIKYDEKVDEIFGVKDSVIIGVVNDEEGIFNPATLSRIARLTEEIAALPGVIANRPVDVASLSTATIFVGTDTSIGSDPLMPHVPVNEDEVSKLKKLVYDNSDLFVGNLVSQDGKAAMIRAKLKEGIDTRYRTYFEIKCRILPQETGDWSGMQECASAGGGNWQSGQQPASGANQRQQNASGQAGGWQQGGNSWGQWQQGAGTDTKTEGQAVHAGSNGDKIFLAGRPVIEVTSGLHALKDMQVMIPLLLAAIGITLFLIFRTARGVILPLCVMGASIIWTMGVMALLNVPLYTISTMLPVILVAVSIGDSVHLLSRYYDLVLHDAHRPSSEIVAKVMEDLSLPLVTTSITTAAGFLALSFADMPPFVVFGVFTVLGIVISWLLTVVLIPAVLTVLKPRVGGYLVKRRALRLHAEQSRMTKFLVDASKVLYEKRVAATGLIILVVVLAGIGASRLYVDSSWMSDFRKDSDLVKSNEMFNDKFDGTIFLNVVVEGKNKDAFKDPDLLKHIEQVQKDVEGLPYVGGSRSIVDYIKNMNMTLHAGDRKFDVVPDSEAQIGEYLFLFSVSGRPQQLDEVIDYDYRQGLVTVAIKTDHTQTLRKIIDDTKGYLDREFAGQDVTYNFAGSANNSYVWADLLIGSQTLSILLSKVAILLIASLLFRSVLYGVITIIPLTITTLLIAGIAGYFSIPLDVSTALAAGVAIGVGVDYAVHFIYRFKDELANGADVLAAIQETMRSVGRTIIFNAVVVTIGFAVLFSSQFPPHIKLGYFVVSYMVASCLMALTILPVAFSYMQHRRVQRESMRAT